MNDDTGLLVLDRERQALTRNGVPVPIWDRAWPQMTGYLPSPFVVGRHQLSQ